MKIKISDYNYKDDKTHPQTGYIAQQLYTVFPNAVIKGGDDAKTHPWMVDYGRVTPLIIKAIQDQQKEIDAKDAKINDMQNQINSILQKLNELQNVQVGSSQNASVSSKAVASLKQNAPNPFSNTTIINYTLPQHISSAQVIINDLNGNTVQKTTVSTSGSITVAAGSLTSGTYKYSLIVDGKIIDTKTMVITK